MLTQPSYSRFGKRTWRVAPYALAILNACVKDTFETEFFDPNLDAFSDNAIVQSVRDSKADAVGVTTCSTEYLEEAQHMTRLIRAALPDATIVEGGILPTVALDTAMKDENVDYWIIGEGEVRFPEFLRQLSSGRPDWSHVDGLAYYDHGEPRITSPGGWVTDLDSVPFPDYGNLELNHYATIRLKYAQGLCARRYPFATTITSRGCPYGCTFCAAATVSGKRVRMRSAANVLQEIDHLYERGIKEVILLDDHFLFHRGRAMDIMNGLVERDYDLIWECANLTVWLLDEELLDLMKETGSYQVTFSIESGNQDVLDKLVKKPVDLRKAMRIIRMAKQRDFEIIANFVIGFPV